ncbi:MAG: PilZ domain-containing protein [Desulfobacterales bacterium]|nr:PilZ domain-containing protein [Desulfobacterales bacterium]
MAGIERRKNPRVESLNLLSYVCLDENNRALDQGMGRTLNVSKGGILLEIYNPVDPAHTMVLAIGLKDNMVDIKGKVVHSRTDEDGKIKSGVQFIEMDKETLLTLEAYITEFEKQN